MNAINGRVNFRNKKGFDLMRCGYPVLFIQFDFKGLLIFYAQNSGHIAPELYPKPRVSDLFKKFKRKVFTIDRFLVLRLKIVPIVNRPAISAFFQYKSIAKCPNTGKVVPGREKEMMVVGIWKTGQMETEHKDTRTQD